MGTDQTDNDLTSGSAGLRAWSSTRQLDNFEGGSLIPSVQLRPASDVSLGSWTSTGANAFSVLDEAVANDADYITSPASGSVEVALQAGSTPQAGDVTIVVRHAKP
jgi:hypothetical protein